MTRLARFAARRHRLVLIGALLVFLGLGAFGVGAFGALGDAGQNDPSSASSRASALIDQRFGGTGTGPGPGRRSQREQVRSAPRRAHRIAEQAG